MDLRDVPRRSHLVPFLRERTQRRSRSFLRGVLLPFPFLSHFPGCKSSFHLISSSLKGSVEFQEAPPAPGEVSAGSFGQHNVWQRGISCPQMVLAAARRSMICFISAQAIQRLQRISSQKLFSCIYSWGSYLGAGNDLIPGKEAAKVLAQPGCGKSSVQEVRS